ncbi:hypothetical protein [Clostridium sp.]|uniref:hypothetical protein n=1 Tax=Clostridium sp. TaxID=1506 RepID=UPI001DC372D3|nr:hypothetical protein [Clostridium sp.]MBS5307814.1 hypothetical protein [Clostridium sp.]
MNLATLFSTFQLVGGVVLFISYLPMIKLLHTTKSAKNQSISFWIILDVGMVLFELNALYLAITLGQLSYAISQSLNLLCGIIVLIQLLIYRKND